MKLLGGKGSQKTNFLKESMIQNWNSQGDGVEGQTKRPVKEGVWINWETAPCGNVRSVTSSKSFRSSSLCFTLSVTVVCCLITTRKQTSL